jgi:hypothetical protein
MRKSTFGIVVLLVAGFVALSFYPTEAATKFVKKADVYKAMAGYSKALGVKCSFCHTKDKSQNYQELAGKSATNGELGALVRKRTARAMQGMMMLFNKEEGKGYTCNTCHRGESEVDPE